MTETERLHLLKLIENKQVTEKEEIEILQILEAERREQALADYSVFAPEYIRITDKAGNEVPFVHNPIQKAINDTIKELKAKKRAVLIIILKARQHGASTNEQGRMLYNTTTNSNRFGLIVAHRDETCTEIFNKAKYMYDHLPAHVKPLQKASNAKELVFDKPAGYKGKLKGLNSKIIVQVAGSVNIGQGFTPQYVHLSEFSRWPSPEGQEPKKQLAGIMQAVPMSPDTEVVIESTAWGYNDFKDLWDAAVAGENEWVALFFPWQDNPEYVMICTEEEYQREISSIKKEAYEYLFGSVKNNKKKPGVVETFKLSKEQVRWWIWYLKNKCNNDLNEMKQYNPTVPEDAFIASGRPVFDMDIVKLRLDMLRKKYKTNPPKRGRFAFEWETPDKQDSIKEKSIRWVDENDGPITIYEPPMAGYPYVMGGDTKGEGRDFYSGTVINNVTGNRAATVRNCWNNSKPYTWQMYCLGHFYNLALIGIEVNFNTGPIEELERLHYPRQYQRKKYDDLTGEFKNAHGWKTDGNSRPLIIDKEIHTIDESIELFNDVTMLEECMTFIYDKNDKPDAMSGKHDDALFSDMIANEIRRHQSFEAERDPEIVHRSFDQDNECDSKGIYKLSPFN
jgi:hypothetical protein